MTHRRIVDQFRKRPPWSPTQPPRGPETPAGARLHGVADGTARTSTVERVPDPGSYYDLETAWDGEWREHMLDRALARVKQKSDPEQFQMFDLHVRRGMPARDVARQLDVTVARVYVAKYKVSALLKREVQRLEKLEH